MEGLGTPWGDRVLERAKDSREYARLQYRYFREELASHKEDRTRRLNKISEAEARFLPCKAGCNGCVELQRVLTGLEAMWRPEERERYP